MKETPDGTKFLTRKDVMKSIGIGDSASLELFNNPEFPAIRFGRSWLIEVNAFRKYVSERHVANKLVY
ncbi:MAG: hypothetical protein IKG42_06285 [Clostridia bacterium]|jgi:hypothetical protein|nr:hypothetical protein [Clostridia bacterium]